MAGITEEPKLPECVCQRTASGECVCSCDAPCAYDAERKTKEMVCKYDIGGITCQCKFQVKCNRNEGGCPAERDVFVCKCQCEVGECTFRIRKCACCEIIRAECGTCGGVATEGRHVGGACCAPEVEVCKDEENRH